MVQLKVQSPLVVGKFVVKQWGPSLSDCLEIQASFQKGLAVKGTWKCVSTFTRRDLILVCFRSLLYPSSGKVHSAEIT